MTAHQLPDHVASADEIEEAQRMAVFVAIHYSMYWLQTPLLAQAPRHDFEFWKAMKGFEVYVVEL